ncbi:hypothetical protein [Sedimentisphaera salicampi]|uniref:hypothetical protein n=1 Tax=Sedimentisphaera salicampi TaxID=1941349 RepID=UPI000B9B46C6|nr:hypothetical protein [Sedimentisphaera salicampi]OXU15404.1 hypothetical protein SMSP1_00885 [Sedimentisphaera salicampi]
MQKTNLPQNWRQSAFACFFALDKERNSKHPDYIRIGEMLKQLEKLGYRIEITNKEVDNAS